MPEATTLEAPPAQPPKQPFRFNSANAREYAARSAARRRAEPFKFPPVAQAEPPKAPIEPDGERLDLLAEQITLTRKALNEDVLLAHHRAALLRALCDLLDQQRIARGEPLPGSRRPAPEGKRQVVASAGPWVPGPVAPAPAPPARPLGWEYDG